MIKKYIFLIGLILAFSISAADAKLPEQGYDINITYTDGKFYFNSVIINPSIDIENLKELGGDYYAEIISQYNKSIEKIYFSIPGAIIYDTFDPHTGSSSGGGIIKPNDTDFIIQVPYYENAREIKIYDFYGFEMLSVPVSQLAKDLCGDGICQNYESAEKCPSDCAKPAIGIETEEAKPLTETIAETASNPWLWGVIGAILLVIFIVILIIRSNKPEQAISSAPA
jgi:hypothetical protein